MFEKHFVHMIDLVDFLMRVIQQHGSTLMRCLDCDNGFADSLLSRGVLSVEQHARIMNQSSCPRFQDQNTELISIMMSLDLNDDSVAGSFMDALIETGQMHVSNFIMDAGMFRLDLSRLLQNSLICSSCRLWDHALYLRDHALYLWDHALICSSCRLWDHALYLRDHALYLWDHALICSSCRLWDHALSVICDRFAKVCVCL